MASADRRRSPVTTSVKELYTRASELADLLTNSPVKPADDIDSLQGGVLLQSIEEKVFAFFTFI